MVRAGGCLYIDLAKGRLDGQEWTIWNKLPWKILIELENVQIFRNDFFLPRTQLRDHTHFFDVGSLIVCSIFSLGLKTEKQASLLSDIKRELLQIIYLLHEGHQELWGQKTEGAMDFQ